MPHSPFSRLRQLNSRGCLWTYILCLLQDKPTHAYALRKEIQERFGFQPGVMTAYKVLYLLYRGGYVQKSPEGRRTVYRITGKGRRELEQAEAFYLKLAKTLS